MTGWVFLGFLLAGLGLIVVGGWWWGRGLRPGDSITETTALPNHPLTSRPRAGLTCDLCGTPIAYRTAHGLRRCAKHKDAA
jgi:hypothetical protein